MYAIYYFHNIIMLIVKIDVTDSLVLLGEKIWFLNWETNPGPLD